MRVEFVCEMCGERFSYAKKNRGRHPSGRRRLFCDECIAERARIVARRYRHVADDDVIIADANVIIADPLPSSLTYSERIAQVADRRAREVSDYVDHLLAAHRRREQDAIDLEAAKHYRVEVRGKYIIENRGQPVIGCKASTGRPSKS